MKPAHETLQALIEAKVVAVVRLNSGAAINDVTSALIAGGIRCIEVTMTVPDALQCIEYLASMPELVAVGAGTVLTAQQTHQSIYAGADFVVSPAIVQESIEIALKKGIVRFPER